MSLENRLSVSGKYMDGTNYGDVVEASIYFEEIEERILQEIKDICEASIEFKKMGSPKNREAYVVDPATILFITDTTTY